MDIFTIKKLRFFLFSSMLLLSSALFAQVPANDEPCGAIVLTPTASCNFVTYTTVDASDSQAPGVPNPTPYIGCGQYSGADVWFKITVPTGATSVVIDTKNLTMTDGAMTVYTATGTCPTLTLAQVACDDDGSFFPNPGMPGLTIAQPPGTVLYVRMYGQGGEIGTFGICVTANIPPVNDDCLNAIALTINADYNCAVVTTGQTTINATQSLNTPFPTCSSTGTNDDVWYSFTATSTDHRISLLSLAPTNATMAINLYSGNCGTLIQEVCNTGSVADLAGLTIGTAYLVRVYTTTPTVTTNASFSICLGTKPPPPTNDDCAAAANLTVNATLTCTTTTAGTTQSATLSASAPVPSCGTANGFNDDVWYSFTATSSVHRLSLSNILPAATGMVMVVYSGTCGTLTEIGCNTNPIATNPLIITGLTAGNIYFVRVFTNSASTTVVANFNICVVTPPPPPLNDECVAAIGLTVNPTLTCTAFTSGTTQSATLSATLPVPSCGTVNGWNDDVWFSFIATSTSHRISLANINPLATNMVVVAYSGTCAAFTEIGCNTLLTPMGLFGLTIGNTYYVRVFTNSVDPLVTATFDICVSTPPPPPANDECAGAVNLSINPNFLCGVVTTGNTVNATPSVTAPIPSCSSIPLTFNDDVWYSFIATNTSHRITTSNVVGTTSTLVKTVYSGSCATLTEIACNAANSFNLNGLTVGNTYYVRIFTASVLVTDAATSFDICVGTPPPPPVNDDCAAAFNLTVNSNLLCAVTTQGTVTSASASSGAPIPSCAATGADDDVWFKFTAANATHRITLTNIAPTTSMTVVVYSGTCTGLTEIFCNSTNLFNVSGLIVGQVYYVRVFSTANTPNLEVDFRVCVGTLPAPPVNDECSGAIVLPISANLTCANPTAGSTLGATQSATLPTPTCGSANGWNDDIWYTIAATSTSHRITYTNITGPTNDLVTTVYSGTCGALVQVICNTSNSFDATNLVIGDIYYIRVHTSVNTFEDASFNICIGSPAQNRTCSSSIPFCNQGLQFVDYTSTQGVTSVPGAGGTGTIYGCLGSTPNQNWFDIGVSTPGNINIEISQTGGNAAFLTNDVDFAAWGPFTSPADGCSQLFSGGPPLQPITNTGGNNGCSFSTAAIENFRVLNVLPGQFYKLMVTNFSTSNNNLPPFTSTSQFVKLTNLTPVSAGAATLDCNFPCFSANAANNGPVCIGGTFNLTSVGSTTPFSWTGPSGFTSNAQNPTGVVAPNTPGTYIYTVTIGTGTSACVKQTTVIVTPLPTPPVVPVNPKYCQGGNPPFLTATATGTNSLLWYTTPIGGIGVPFIQPSSLITTIYYVAQVTTGGCEGPRSQITVIIIPTPVAPIVSATPVAYCQNALAVPLTATPSTGNLIYYYSVATGGVPVLTLTPATNVVGVFNYYVSQATAFGCESPRVLLPVTITASPPAPTAVQIDVCANTPASPLTATGLVPGATALWYAAATGGLPIPTPTPSNTVSSTYWVSQTLNGCESPRTALTTTITAIPLAPTIAPTQPTYCEGAINPAALSATASAGNTLVWYTVATGGIGTATLFPNTLLTTTYYVSQKTVGGCEGPRTSLIITITPAPVAPAVTSPVLYCQNETAAALSATATTGNSILYFTTSTGGTGVTSYIPPTSTIGTVTYYASQITANSCEGPRTAINVTVKAIPPPPTTTPLIFCEGTTLTQLTTGVLVPGGTAVWYATLTGGSPIATPTPSNTANSTYYVTQTLNGCESTPRTALVTTITPTPLAPTLLPPQPIYCAGATNALPLTATASTGNTLVWYTVAIGGIGTATLTPNTAATTTYYVSQMTDAASGGCEGPRTPITINITPAPVAPAVTSPVTYCQDETTVAALSAIATAGNSILYYTLATGGVGVTTLTPDVTTPGIFTYYAGQVTANGCESVTRTAIIVTVNARPAPPTTTAQTFCAGTTLLSLTAGNIVTGATVNWYNTLTGGSPIATPTPINTANSTYYVTQTLNGCESTPRTALVTTITPIPAVPAVSATQPIYCQGASNAAPLTAIPTGTNTLLWYTVATGGTGIATLTPNTTATNTYYVSQITSAATGGCESPRTPITIIITPTPAAPAVTSTVITYCQNETPVAALSATPTAGNTILYYTVPTGGAGTGVTTLTPSTTTPGTTIFYAAQVTSNSCEGPRTAINVIVKPRPSALPQASAQIFCEGASILPLSIPATVAGSTISYYNNLTGGLPIAAPTPSSAANSTFYVTQTLNGCESTPRTAVSTTITPTPLKPVLSSPVKLCPSEVALPLTATPLPGNTLLWYTSLTGIGSATAPTPSTTTQGNTTYYVSQITANGCEGPKETMLVTVSNNSLLVNAGADTTICEGRKIKLIPIVSSPLATFEWRAVGVPLNTIDSIFIKDASVSPVNNAKYIVRASLNGCFVEDEIDVTVIWKPIIDAGKNIPICLNDSVLLKGILSHNSNNKVEFLWTSIPADSLNTPKALQTYAHPLKKTLYTITATTDSLNYGCNFSVYDSMIVAIQPIIKAFAGKDTIAATGVSHQLHGTGGLNYEWSSSSGINITNPFSQNAYVKLTNDANFYLRVTDVIGCEGFDSIFVKVYNGNTFYVPNSFTPNGDGLNDVFRAIPVGMSNTVYFRVFNRLGELMFETNQYLKGWDGSYKGKPQPNGVYVWMVGGTDKDKKKVSMQGTVMIIR